MGDYRLKLTAPDAVFDEAKGCLRIVASVETPDRDDEIVVPRTLRLDNYRKNPVVIWAHKQDQHPIARCEDDAGNFTCRLDERGRLVQEWYFGTTAEAKQAAQLYRDKVLRGASIGFVSDGLEDVPLAEAERLYGVKKRLKRHIGGELVETSAVPVPSCPGALALGWVDAPAAAAMARRGVLTGLVTKAFAPFPRLAQATRPRKMATAKPKVRSPGAKTVSTTATDTATADTTAKAAADTTTKVADEVTTKDAAATDDTATTDPGDASDDGAGNPHEQVKAGLQNAMHECMACYHKGEMSWEDAKAMMDEYAADHDKYSGADGSGEDDADGDDDEAGDKDRDEDDTETEEKEVDLTAIVTKAVEAALAPLKAKLDELPDAEELAEAIATR